MAAASSSSLFSHSANCSASRWMLLPNDNETSKPKPSQSEQDTISHEDCARGWLRLRQLGTQIVVTPLLPAVAVAAAVDVVTVAVAVAAAAGVLGSSSSSSRSSNSRSSSSSSSCRKRVEGMIMTMTNLTIRVMIMRRRMENDSTALV